VASGQCPASNGLGLHASHNLTSVSNNLITLARKLRVVDYFTLGWGTMVGVGWLVVMWDWLLRGGVLGGVLGFAIGGALLLPIGYVYGRLVMAMPDAAGEVAYTAKVFPPAISFATGWMMVLAYFIVCPWEAVAVGKIAGYIFPALDSIELYRIGGQPVYLPRVINGAADSAKLSRHPLECDLPELDSFWNARAIRCICCLRSEQGFATKLSASIHTRCIRIHPTGDANRPLLYDGVRVGGQGRGRMQPAVSGARILEGNFNVDHCRDSFLYHRHRGCGLRCSVERTY